MSAAEHSFAEPAGARPHRHVRRLLAEVAMTYPLAGYTAAVEADDEESAFNHQILAGLVSP